MEAFLDMRLTIFIYHIGHPEAHNHGSLVTSVAPERPRLQVLGSGTCLTPHIERNTSWVLSLHCTMTLSRRYEPEQQESYALSPSNPKRVNVWSNCFLIICVETGPQIQHKRSVHVNFSDTNLKSARPGSR